MQFLVINDKNKKFVGQNAIIFKKRKAYNEEGVNIYLEFSIHLHIK